jgi:sortase (surface protein transpeptidase)
MRRWWLVLAACLTVALVVPVAWFATRPSQSEGIPVTTAGATATPTPTPTESTATRSTLPKVSARPATPQVGDGIAVRPVSMRIPAIGLTAAVDPVGVEDDGSMVIPKEVDRVGWYRYGAAPGSDAGAAVVAGHVDSRRLGPGALFRLREIGVGDRVDVRLDNGRKVTYAVVGKQTLVKKRLPTQTLFARDGAPRLVLITCGGPFIRELSSYRDNLVVVAEPVRGAG